MDERIVHVDQGEPEEAGELTAALEIGRVLERHYPHHPWLISFSGGALVIRHLPIANAVSMATGREGFGQLLKKELQKGTHKDLCDQAVKAGGALLEAFSLPRGPWDGRDPIVPQDLIQAAKAGKAGRDLIHG